MIIKIIHYFLATLVLILSSIVVAGRFKSKSLLDRVLEVYLLAVSQIILSELFLGVVIRSLTSENLLLTNSAIFMIACGLLLIRSKPLDDLKIFIDLHPLFEMIKGSVFNKFLLGLMAVQISIILFIGTFFAPGVWDCWTYHLTSVAYWLQDQAIKIIDTPVTRSNIFPINSELLNLWNAIFLKSDRIVSLTQFPFALMGLIAVYGLSRKIGLNKQNSFIASVLFFFTPLVVLQSSTAQNDVITATTFLVGTYFAISFTEFLNLRDLIFCGISAGILVGVKSQGLLFSLFLLGYLLIRTWKRGGLGFLVRISLIYVVPVVVLGGFAYFRNWIYFQNPFYPVTIEILGIKIFRGNPSFSDAYIQPGLTTLIQNVVGLGRRWFEIHDQFGVPEISSYGPQWIILGIPSIIYIFIYCLIQRLNEEAKHIIKPLSFILFSFIAFLFTHKPNPWDMRLTLFLPAGGAIATGFFFQHASYPHRTLIKFVAVLSILYVLINSTVYNLYAPLSEFRLVVNLPPSERTIGNLGPWPEKLGAYRVIDSLAQSGDTIGYLTHGDGWIYPLFGRHFDRKVYNIDKRNAEEVLAWIKSRRIKYLILNKEANPKIRRIIKESPNLFLLKYEGENCVYHVLGQIPSN